MRSLIKIVSNVKLAFNLDIVNSFDYGVKSKFVFDITFLPVKSMNSKHLIVSNLSQTNNHNQFSNSMSNVNKSLISK